jgi:hydrogenase maturation protease
VSRAARPGWIAVGPGGRVLVAGLGNLFRGDDAFGCEVVWRLQGRDRPDGVVIEDFGVRFLDLAHALGDAWTLVILVVALSRGDAPGTVYVIDPEPFGVEAPAEGHTAGAIFALRLADALHGRRPPVLLVGCEPARPGVDGGQGGLSRAVESGVGMAVALVESLVSGALSPEVISRA